MSIGCTIKYKQELWEYVWLNSAPGLEKEVLTDILYNIIDMGYDRDDIRTIKNQDYDAKIFKRKRQVVGMFAGTQFDSEFETEKGNSNLSVLLLNKINPKEN